MHIILGVLGAIITILVLLNRLAEAGIDLGGLNPFLWSRRRKWRNKYKGNPIFKMENPMDATAILMVAVVKADGDMTKEDKSLLLNLFENEFHLTKKDAAGLLISSVYLLGDGSEVKGKIKSFLSPSKKSFTEEQANSAISLITKVAGNPNTIHPNVQEILDQVNDELQPIPSSEQKW